MRTIILAAGKSNFKNKPDGLSSSHLLTLVNGRPIISWVLSGTLNTSKDQVTLVLSEKDFDVVELCNKHFARNPNFKMILGKSEENILFSLQKGLENSSEKKVRVVLGDTLIADHKNVFSEDSIYVSKFTTNSSQWCVCSAKDGHTIEQYFNKESNLSKAEYYALVGRYEFSDSNQLKLSVSDAIRDNKYEISDALVIYSTKKSLKAKHIEKESWIDFGHLEGISTAKRQLLESRPFNTLEIHKVLPIIIKKSTNIKKLSQELHWYQQLPAELKSLAPQVIEYTQTDEVASLHLEYYGYGTLTEKFIFFDLSLSFWEKALAKLFDTTKYLEYNYSSKAPNKVNLLGLYYEKTMNRLQELKDQNDSWKDLLSKDILQINQKKYFGIRKLQAFIKERSDELSKTANIAIIHGDYCFNNILYDLSSGVIKLIDPRGEFGTGEATVYGDTRYEIAKLRHSFCGNYDHVIEGLYRLTIHDAQTFEYEIFNNFQDARDQLFDKLCADYAFDIEDIKFIEGLLFLSMTPIHKQSLDKQIIFFLQGIMKLNECYKGSNLCEYASI